MPPASGVDARAVRPLVQVRELCTYFPQRRGPFGRIRGFFRAVDGVSFDIDEGTTLGLVGESGCGKTTLVRTILRLTPATTGRVWVADHDVLAASRVELRTLRRNVQLVFQDTAGSLNPRMRIGRIIAEPLVIQGVGTPRQRRQRVAELLAAVGLRPPDADRYPHELSGGQRQRVGIARALALGPRLLVCDEPVSALDVSVQAQILNLLADLQRDLGLTYLFIAHNLAVVRSVSDRVAVMYAGRIVEIAGADDLYVRPRHPYTHALLAAVPRLLRDAEGTERPTAPDARLESSPMSKERSWCESGRRPDIIRGCVFCARCPYVTDECRSVVPRLGTHPGLASGHLVACHRVEVTTDMSANC